MGSIPSEGANFSLRGASDMKLGEALKLRSDNLRKIEELRVRAVASAQIQEGTKPPDDSNELIAEIERLRGETTDLIQRINRTNVATRLSDGSVLADALAQRDAYLALRGALQGIAKAAAEPQQRYMRSEIRVVRTVDAAAILKRADDLSRKHRQLDALIQELNWSTELTD
ncbi:MAG TPA: DIP1984 family protein [Candidatus Eremiobacteraceae bacterium]|nr:DIP1984 family protein [Candidatus Eremiobacteraceae bacterium]